MRIGFDANPIFGHRGGVGWHTYHLLRALLDLKDDLEFVGYVRPGTLAGQGAGSGLLEGWMRSPQIRWVECGKLALRWRGRRDGLDLFHGPNFKMPTMGRYGGIVTLHDLWLDRHPEYSPKLLGQRLSCYRTRRMAWRARKVITISAFSAQDIMALYGLPADRIAVIPNGVSGEFWPDRQPEGRRLLQQRFRLPAERYLLFVGGADHRKNHTALLRAYAARSAQLHGYCLVMVGGAVHRTGNIPATAARLGIADRVVCTGHLPLVDLRLLYSHAEVFVFPSLYEGFGMPVLEAMACGAPVITSNTTSLPEVAGDAALLVNPNDPEELGNAIMRLLTDQTLRESLRVRGRERAKRFTWERAARQTLAVYREVCSERTSWAKRKGEGNGETSAVSSNIFER